MKKSVEEGISNIVNHPKPTILRMSVEGINLIKNGGFIANSYKGYDGQWRIGYGSTKYPDMFPIIEGESCSVSNAEKLLDTEVDVLSYTLNNFLIKNRVKITEQQFSALIAFIFSLGVHGAIKISPLSKALKTRDMVKVADTIKKFCKVRKTFFGIPYYGKSIKLIREREREINLFWS